MIAILFEGDLDNRKGATNAVLSRSKYFKELYPDIEIWCVETYEPIIVQLLRHRPIRVRKRLLKRQVDGLEINVLWRRFSIIDYYLNVVLKKKPLFRELFIHRASKAFGQYDLILAHSDFAGEIALEIKKRCQIPYCITWHGSDINHGAFARKWQHDLAEQLIINAECNFFVSNTLLKKSNDITDAGRKMVLYNGVSDDFQKYCREKRIELRDRYVKNQSAKVVAFVGNLMPIKNAILLPDIFNEISKKFEHEVVFWIIGDGKLRSKINERISELGLRAQVHLFGDIPYEKMVELYNCIDLLILPSQNEGLPLTIVEALKCGCNVIGSTAGGIPEVLGVDYVAPLGDDFISILSDKAIMVLNNCCPQTLSSVFSWESTAKKEYEVCDAILKKN